MSHLFSKFDLDLDVAKFKESKIEFYRKDKYGYVLINF